MAVTITRFSRRPLAQPVTVPVARAAAACTTVEAQERIAHARYEPHDVTDDEAALQADGVEERLAAVAAALQRIEFGAYGDCEACGSPIDARCLDALPFTATCAECSSRDAARGSRRTTRRRDAHR